MVAHTDAVWGLSIHNTKMQLLSCSADGTVRLWSPGSKSPLLNTFTVDSGKLFPSPVLLSAEIFLKATHQTVSSMQPVVFKINNLY